MVNHVFRVVNHVFRVVYHVFRVVYHVFRLTDHAFRVAYHVFRAKRARWGGARRVDFPVIGVMVNIRGSGRAVDGAR
jgi:hypothetical protein